jgi:hypothetical protein
MRRERLLTPAPWLRARQPSRLCPAADGIVRRGRQTDHGEFTARSVDFKKEITALARMARKKMAAIEYPDAIRPAFAWRVSCQTFSWRWPHACVGQTLSALRHARFTNLAVAAH